MSRDLLASSSSHEVHAQAVRDYFDDIFVNLPRNTQRAYISDFNEFRIFCDQEGLPGLVNSLTDNEACIKHYVGTLCKSPLAYKTIRRRLSALSKFMGIARLPNPLRDSAYLRDFIKLQLAANEKLELGNQAAPLTLELIEQINETVIPETLLEMRDLAMVNLMFDGLLRADEVVKVTLERFNRRQNTLLVPRSKADQTGKGSFRYVSDTTLGMIDEYVDEANRFASGEYRPTDDPKRINKGILFRPLSPKGRVLLPYDESLAGRAANVLNYSSVYRIFVRIGEKAQLPYRISPHSGRVGAAVSLAEQGYNELEIQRAGDWSSVDMPAHYTRQARTNRGGMAKLARKHSR